MAAVLDAVVVRGDEEDQVVVAVLDVAVLAVVHLTHLVDSLIAPDMGK